MTDFSQIPNLTLGIDPKALHHKNREIKRLNEQKSMLHSELQNIVNANPRDWEITTDEFRQQFVQWAQSRARHTISQSDALDS